jgi:hypothetical protein
VGAEHGFIQHTRQVVDVINLMFLSSTLYISSEEETQHEAHESTIAVAKRYLPRRTFMPCSAPIITLLDPFRCLFTEPTWKRLLTLLRGTLLARGRRTVTAALWQTGHEQDPHFSAFHQALNRARWSPLQASRH